MKVTKYLYCRNRGHYQVLPRISWSTEMYRHRADYTFRKLGWCFDWWITIAWLWFYAGVNASWTIESDKLKAIHEQDCFKGRIEYYKKHELGLQAIWYYEKIAATTNRWAKTGYRRGEK